MSLHARTDEAGPSDLARLVDQEAIGAPTAIRETPLAPSHQDAGSAPAERMPKTPAAAWTSFGVLAAALGLVGVALFVLWPLLISGFVDDDEFNSQVPMLLKAQDESLWRYTINTSQAWMTALGRFFPGALALTYGIPVVFTDRLPYKTLQLVAVLSNVAVLAALIAAVTTSRAAGLLAGTFVVATFQFRPPGDAILAFAAIQQTIVLCVLGSLLSLRRYLTTSHLRWLAIGTPLWVFSLLTYEVAYLLIPLIPALAYMTRSPRRAKLTAVACIAVPVLLLGLYVVYLRGQATASGNPAYTSNLSPSRVLPAFVLQAFAAVPLSYSIADGPHRVAPSSEDGLLPSWVTGVALVTTIALVVGACRQLSATPWRVTMGLAFSGGVLWFVPALVTAQTQRWQDALRPGWGYISAYTEGYGVAMVCTAAVLAVVTASRRSRPSVRRTSSYAGSVTLALGLFWCFAATAESNRRVVTEINVLTLYPRQVFEESVRDGLFSHVTAGATILSAPQPHWVNSCFISWYGGPRVEVISPDEVSQATLPGCSTPAQYRPETDGFEYAVDSRGGDASAGIVALARNSLGVVQTTRSADVPSNDILLYMKHPSLGQADHRRALVIRCRWRPADAPPTAESEGRTFADGISTLAEGQGWVISRFSVPQGYCLGGGLGVAVR